MAITMIIANFKPSLAIVKSEPFINRMTCEPHNYHKYFSTYVQLQS